MKFLFQLNESKITDFLRFPKFLYQKEDFLESSSLNNYKEAIDESYLDELDHYKALLLPFSKEIEIFYSKNFHEFDFVDFFTRNIPLANFTNSSEYLAYISKLDAITIKNYIVEALNEDSEEGGRLLNTEPTNEEITSFLESFNLEAVAKWNLLLIIQEPLRYLKRYMELMIKLLPIFEEIYVKFEHEVKEYGEKTAKYLTLHGERGLEDLTNSLINKSYLINEESRLIISALFAYTIVVTDGHDNNLIYWGLRVESVLKKIKAINVDKLNERVQAFKYLGDKTKYEVLKHISRGITSTKEIARLTNVSSATISYHINSFLTSKIIKLDNSNRKFSYIINYELLEEIINDFKDDLNFNK